MSLFTDDRKVYVENPKYSTKKLLELISDYGRVAGYKDNIQKSAALGGGNEQKRKKKELITTGTNVGTAGRRGLGEVGGGIGGNK